MERWQSGHHRSEPDTMIIKPVEFVAIKEKAHNTANRYRLIGFDTHRDQILKAAVNIGKLFRAKIFAYRDAAIDVACIAVCEYLGSYRDAAIDVACIGGAQRNVFRSDTKAGDRGSRR